MAIEDNELILEEAELLGKSLEYDKDSVGFIDPLTIIMLVSLIVNVIRMIQGCRKKSDEVKSLSKLRFGHLRVANTVYATIGPKEYEKHGSEIVTAIINRGDTITVERLQKLLAALDE